MSATTPLRPTDRPITGADGRTLIADFPAGPAFRRTHADELDHGLCQMERVLQYLREMPRDDVTGDLGRKIERADAAVTVAADEVRAVVERMREVAVETGKEI